LQNLNFFPINIGWIVKIDSIGNIEWQKLIGGSDYDELFNVSLTSDNGYMLQDLQLQMMVMLKVIFGLNVPG
jgi:hypothetical protein